nr:Flp1 family type IVb pilin [Coprococcus sp. AF21-14LB]
MNMLWIRWKQSIENLKEDSGIGVVEVLLILVVLIGLVLIFKSQLTSIVNSIFQKIVNESSGI